MKYIILFINNLLSKLKKIQPLSDENIKAILVNVPPRNEEPLDGGGDDGGGSFILFEFSESSKEKKQ